MLRSTGVSANAYAVFLSHLHHLVANGTVQYAEWWAEYPPRWANDRKATVLTPRRAEHRAQRARRLAWARYTKRVPQPRPEPPDPWDWD